MRICIPHLEQLLKVRGETKIEKTKGNEVESAKLFTPVTISISLYANNCNDLVTLAHYSTSTEDWKRNR